jgi:BlaI family penicillinase repressor
MLRISPAESQIMAALWQDGPMSADELVRKVGEPQQWGEATVKTLINRLLKRKAIRSDRIDGRARYAPIIQRADYVQAESQSLLNRLFDGQLTPLVAHFAQHRALSTDEIKQLKTLIEGLEHDG